jgi:hypothetical protein
MDSHSGGEIWMDAQHYAQLTSTEKQAVSAAIETYEKAVAAADQAYDIAVAEAKKAMKDAIAVITEGKWPPLV